MSAKNRGGESVPFDSYPTPKPYIRAFLLDVLPYFARPTTEPEFLDPFCGAGAMLEVAEEFGIKDIYGLELQPELGEIARGKGFPVRIGDSLDPKCIWPSVKLTVSNPPYTHAEAAFRKALNAAKPVGGVVSFLLRLGFLASDERADFFDEFGMPKVQVVKRPSFCMTVKCKACGDRYTLPPEGPRPKTCRLATPVKPDDSHCPAKPKDLGISTTDAADYAWMTYGPGIAPSVSRLEVQ